jgi:arginyl-tRNA synthetase
MNLFEDLRQDVVRALSDRQAKGDLPADLAFDRVTAEPPRDQSHGDVSTNAALVLAKQAKTPPMAIAEMLVADLLALDRVVEAEIAGPGFVNLRLDDDLWRDQVRTALSEGLDYGRSDIGKGEAVNVEYCSANPTGPLHIGHGRGTVFGDALANLLEKMGFAVTREYYINDGGIQIDHLARSVHHRYLEALDAAPDQPPEGFYPGDYLIPLGRAIAADDKERWRHAAEVDWLPVFRSRARRRKESVPASRSRRSSGRGWRAARNPVSHIGSDRWPARKSSGCGDRNGDPRS